MNRNQLFVRQFSRLISQQMRWIASKKQVHKTTTQTVTTQNVDMPSTSKLETHTHSHRFIESETDPLPCEVVYRNVAFSSMGQHQSQDLIQDSESLPHTSVGSIRYVPLNVMVNFGGYATRKKDALYSILMTDRQFWYTMYRDRNKASKNKDTNRQWLMWSVANLSEHHLSNGDHLNEGTVLCEYMPTCPPPGQTAHRCTLMVLEQTIPIDAPTMFDLQLASTWTARGRFRYTDCVHQYNLHQHPIATCSFTVSWDMDSAEIYQEKQREDKSFYDRIEEMRWHTIKQEHLKRLKSDTKKAVEKSKKAAKARNSVKKSPKSENNV